jgi:ubiquinone biosynthesis protein
MNQSDGSWWDTIVLVTVALALLIFIGWLAGRILGVKRGLGRAVLAGLVGFLAGLFIIGAQYQGADIEELNDLWALGVGFFGYVLVVTLLASVAIDAIFRPRSSHRRRWSVPHPVRKMRQRLATVARLRQIAAAARGNGLIGRGIPSTTSLATPEGARALRKTLEDAGGILVKFGQIASTREDLLPDVLTHELASLRTSVPGLPVDVVHAVIESELGAPVSEIFASFEDTPLAAASIGVTHRATFKDGRSVIVKVQRPGIEASVNRDGSVLIWAARQLQRRSESAERLGLAGLATELVAGITEELDFTQELANNAAMRASRGDVHGVEMPEIFADYTTKRVLVMEAVDGVPVSEREAIEAAGIPRAELAGHLIDSFLTQVLTNGVYHADPHPGNVLIDREGRLWLIDYGAVGHLDPITLEGLQQLAIGFTMRDPSLLARGVRRLAGHDADDLDIAALEFDLGSVLTDIQGGGFDPSSLAEVLKVLSRRGIKPPESLTVLARAALTIDGTLRIIDPDFRMGPATQERMARLVIPAELDPRDQLLTELVRALPALRSVPQLSEDIALQARSGRLTLRVDRWSGDDGHRLDRWISQIVFTTIGVVGLVASALILIAAGLAPNESVGAYLRVIGFVGIIASTAMQLRVVARVLSRRDRDDPY